MDLVIRICYNFHSQKHRRRETELCGLPITHLAIYRAALAEAAHKNNNDEKKNGFRLIVVRVSAASKRTEYVRILD